MEKLQGTGTVPDQALTKAVQNTLSDRESWLVGIDSALAEIPEDERFGAMLPPDGTDPSALTQNTQTTNGGKEADPVSPTTRATGGSGGSARAAQ